MQVKNAKQVPIEVASGFINIESSVDFSNLIVTAPPGEPNFIGRCYEMSPIFGGGDDFCVQVQNALKGAPENSLVQVTLLCAPDFDCPYIYATGKNKGGAIISELVEMQAQMLHKALRPGSLPELPGVNVKTLFVTLMKPVKDLGAETVEVELAAQNEFMSGLKSTGFTDVKTCSAEDIKAIYRQMSNPLKPRGICEVDDQLDLRRQIFGTDAVFDFTHSRHALFDEEVYCAAVAPKTLSSKVRHGVTNLLIGAPLNSGKTEEGGGLRIKIPFMLSTTVRVANQRKEADRVAAAIKSRERNDKMWFSLGAEDSAAKLKDLKLIQKICGDGTNPYSFLSMCAFVFSRDKDEIAEAVASIKTTFDNLGFDSRQVVGNVGVRFVQSLPLNFSIKIQDKLESEACLPARAAACLMPIFGDSSGNADTANGRSGTAFISRRGTVHYFNPFRTPSGKNGWVGAKTRVGKSVLLQEMAKNHLAEGDRVYVFENGKSVKKFCKAVDGEYIEFTTDDTEKSSLNPFSGLEPDEFDAQQDIISSMMLKMAYFQEPVDPGARIAAQEAVRSAWASKMHKADIYTVIEALETTAQSGEANNQSQIVIAARNLIPRLKAFMDAPVRGKFFKGTSNFNPRNPFTVFDLSGLDSDPHLKQCVLFFVMKRLMESIKRLPGGKLVLLDEVAQLILDEGAAGVVEGMYRMAGKDDASIWVFTQSPCDLKDSHVGQIIMAQSHWKIMLQLESEEVDRAVNEGVISSFAKDPFFGKCVKDIRSRKGLYSEALICSENNYEPVRLYINRFTAALFSSEGAERHGVFDMMRNGADVMDAVHHVIGDTQTKRAKWLRNVIKQLREQDLLSDEDIETELMEALNG